MGGELKFYASGREKQSERKLKGERDELGRNDYEEYVKEKRKQKKGGKKVRCWPGNERDK